MIKEATRVEECRNGLPPPARGEGEGRGGQWGEDRGKFENLFVLRSILMTEK